MSERLLLDTHVLLWALMEPDRLSANARSAIASTDNQLFVSSVSALEIATKFRLGKLSAANELVKIYPRVIAQLGATSLPIDDHHAIAAGLLSHPHRDPFDRLLAMQAKIEDLTLVSGDAFFSELPGVTTLW
jgi:PIN domain nuclease of toxin-antitoxin system